ncbi:MAG: M20 family metallo-hydrolase [Nitrososphaeria archaeon]|nr:M20 family metallo-hydrolase [Aigarchaeota archaeon]MCX8187642.1 M20 family metallo-hydrolase [Nitrososphaeria archaeon]MDW8021537.1 M20 family metallo-hydrolase [Nitrososphaerota archaeon]
MEELIRRIRKASDRILQDVVEAYIEVLKIPAVNPSSGGCGEFKRAEKLQSVLREFGVKNITRVDVADNRVEEGVRPNIISIVEGEDEKRTLWLIAHMDTVPEGDLGLWETDPFVPVMRDGKIYARGAEDDGQAIASILLAVRTIAELGLRPRTNLGLAFVSDEEAGSKYGLEHLVNKGFFKEGDEAVVLDYGSPDGSEIEVAEKHMLWLKFTVRGAQAHAAFPHQGINAHRFGARLLLALDNMLHERFGELDELYIPPRSTFEPTKKEPNVDNVNTIPGTDVFYFDCRILPRYFLDEVSSAVKDLCKEFESAYGVKIDVEEVMRWEAPPPTSPGENVVKKLSEVLRLMRGIDAKIIGIGGGTCAALLRARGIPAVAWSTSDVMAHKPNEYCRIENIRRDAEALALLSLII